MKFFVFDGSPQEFAEVAPMMGLQTVPLATMSPSLQPVPLEPTEVHGNLTVEQIKHVLSRRPLAENMKAMLQMLYKAGEERVSSAEIKKALKLKGPNFRGMKGAFGRRLANSGLPPGSKFLDEVWNYEKHMKTWTLSDNARKAIEELGIV